MGVCEFCSKQIITRNLREFKYKKQLHHKHCEAIKKCIENGEVVKQCSFTSKDTKEELLTSYLEQRGLGKNNSNLTQFKKMVFDD